MNDFEELKQLFEKVSAAKKELKRVTDEINKSFLIFEDMNYDCDDEIDEIEDQIEELTEDLQGSLNEDLQSKIDKLINKKELVLEAADILNKLEEQFIEIQSISDEIDVEV
ncbi:MAG: hypothetical protein JXR69_01605 [Candidatus Delongbacteria bacterium]|nr:hypothetical protein [Candidatus Delongbacteria bacterium]